MKAIIDFLQQQLSAIIQCIPVILHHKHQRNVFLLQSYILLQVATLPNVEPEQIYVSLLVLPRPRCYPHLQSHDLDLMILVVILSEIFSGNKSKRLKLTFPK